MKAKNIIIILVVIVAVVSVFYSFQNGGDDEKAYKERIENERRDKDNFMRNSSESPFFETKGSFKTLSYFPIDTKYKIIASLNPVSQKDVVVLRTSDGNDQHYLKYANAEFELDGVQNKLLILEVMDMGSLRGNLFLTFGDATSAKETYGAGRYLDLRKTPGSSTITLDFNLAYNPYCAYTDKYSCPLPPPENLLSVAIKAGEKNYEH